MAREHSGRPERSFVAPFCGDFIGSETTVGAAWGLAHEYEQGRQGRMRGIWPMNEDDIQAAAEAMVLDVQLEVAAAGMLASLPKWFKDLHEAHEAQRQRFIVRDCLAAAAVFAECRPVFNGEDEYPGCSHHGAIYPCRALRAVDDGTDVWDELVASYEDGWEEQGDK